MSLPGTLDDRVAIVTGAASGIGFDIARDLAARGAKLVICDVADTQDAVAALTRDGAGAIGVRADISDAAQVAAAVAACLHAFGKIDVLVNNAGLFTTISRGPFDLIEPEEWRRVMDVNVTGTWLFCRAVRESMVQAGGGRIINITSATAFSMPPSMLHYVTSKGALTAMTGALARELGPDGITVNAIAPGFTLSAGVVANRGETLPEQSERARGGRAIKRDQMPADLFGAVAFFAGAESGFVTGQTLVVDGGAVMR